MSVTNKQLLVRNAMTIDVEDYFQVSALEERITPAAWSSWPCRVERNTETALQLFADAGVKATFFMLGWVAERYPALVTRVVNEGHELASHGYSHARVHTQTPDVFRDDVWRAKQLLEDLSGVEVKGYRAPSYSINRKNLWALRVLQECGYRYSSSIFPIKHDLYGIPDAPRLPFYEQGTPDLLEIPITTTRFFNRNFPASGGGWFRLFPYTLTRHLLRRVNNENVSAIFYFHPWELDPEQPRPDGLSAKSRFRHYVNLQRTEPRLKQLLNDFSWGRMDELFLHNPAPTVQL